MHHLDTDFCPLPDGGPHIRAQQKYYEMRERYDHADSVRREAKRAMDISEKELIDSMMDSGVSSFALHDGTKVHISRHVGVAVNKDNQDAVRRFLDKQGWDAETYTKTSMNKAAIEEEIKKQLESCELQEFDIPDGMCFKRRQSINVTGWKTRSKEL